MSAAMQNMDKAAQVEGIPAATIVIFRKAAGGGPPEILMVIRSRNMAFAGGAAVFPGGRVDAADHALAAALDHSLGDDDEAAHRIAALRETLEETGLAIGIEGRVTGSQAAEARAMLLEHEDFAPVLEKFGWDLRLDDVVPFARWFPKNERLSRVFDTRFYLYDIGTGVVDISVDATENTRLFWTSAEGALAAAERGEIDIIFPTRRNLERLAQFESFAAAQQDAQAHPVKIITPFLIDIDGVKHISFGQDHGYPTTGEPIESASRG